MMISGGAEANRVGMETRKTLESQFASMGVPTYSWKQISSGDFLIPKARLLIRDKPYQSRLDTKEDTAFGRVWRTGHPLLDVRILPFTQNASGSIGEIKVKCYLGDLGCMPEQEIWVALIGEDWEESFRSALKAECQRLTRVLQKQIVYIKSGDELWGRLPDLVYKHPLKKAAE